MAVRWIVRETSPQCWWAMDQHNGLTLKLEQSEGERLWRMPSHMHALPLHAARAAADGNDGSFVDLQFLGLTMRYWCSEPWAAELARQYASLVPPLRRSADVEVRLGEKADFGRLHRSAEGDVRADIMVRAAGAIDWSAGDASLPIIPAMHAEAFTGRFCALHGALVAGASGGVVICGNQKAGKTTAALTAQQTGFGKVLSDETTLIDRDVTAHGVPLPIRERSPEGRVARALPAASPIERCRGMTITDIVVLHVAEGPAQRRLLEDETEALRLLVPHLRVLNTTLGEAADRLLALIATCNIWRWQVNPWPLLTDDLAAGMEALRMDSRK